MRSTRAKSFIVIIVLLGAIFTSGCRTRAQSGALVGSGIGALAGAAIGGDTEAALIGTAVGSGLGYIIGNEQDKKHAKEINRSQDAKTPTHNEVGALGGSRWKLVSLNPRDAAPPYVSKIVDFKPNGRIITTTTKPDGKVEVFDESYRVAGNTLIINKPGYIINARFDLFGDQLTISAEKFSAVLKGL